jgi:hypothetical protein
MVGGRNALTSNVGHERRFFRGDTINDQFCYRGTVYVPLQHVSMLLRLYHPFLSGRALVDGLFFRHRLVVEPSECLLHHSAWLLIAFVFHGQVFQQFTQFADDVP